MTTVYIARHAQPFRDLLGDYCAHEQEQIRNEKNPLSVFGEQRAQAMASIWELNNIDVLYSSHYVRAMSTAKYIAENNGIKLNIDERFVERKFGIKTWDELPQDFFEHQFHDWNYKMDNGESLNEVARRMQEALQELLVKYEDKRVMIVSHGTALTVMLSKWCRLQLNETTKLIEIYFKDKLVFDGNWSSPELFKLIFDKDQLVSIENIRF